MTNERAGQGVRSPSSTASNVNGKGNVKGPTKSKKQNGKSETDKDMLDISGNFLDDQDFDDKAKIEMLRKSFENKFILLQTEFRAKVDEIKEGNSSKIEMMKEILGKKDELISSLSVRIGKLEADIESLKVSQSFVTKETSEVKNTLEKSFSNNGRKLKELEDKTQDLEDCSRRNNLVIFGVPEDTNTTTEDCDKVICDLLRKHKIIDPEDAHAGLLERAHRLGKKNREQSKPRPIIVLCGSFKDKQYILQNSNKLKGTRYFISEDYSKATLAIRRELVQKGNYAKEKCSRVQSFQVKYKRLVLKYVNPNSDKTFTWSYSLQDTEGRPNWFDPPQPNKSKSIQFVNANGNQKY